jgi:hypothetical protein
LHGWALHTPRLDIQMSSAGAKFPGACWRWVKKLEARRYSRLEALFELIGHNVTEWYRRPQS